MSSLKFTKSFFLWGMSVVYLFAFASLYHQIPGLYGDNGILPVRSVIAVDSRNGIARDSQEIPTLLWLAPAFGLEVSTMMEFLCLLGMSIAFMSICWPRRRDCTNFVLLWMLYFSVYQGGQVFMWFQWDILLLEAGFLSILVAPLGFLNLWDTSKGARPHDGVTLFLVRWLLFRLMFASGVVKLTSQCPTWWGLTALNIHFESQCIPTPTAWFAHHLPHWILSLGVVGTYVIEIAMPFLFFFPIKSIRAFSFHAQILFQLSIIVTGNYNFFNLLTMVLCLSLVDDEYWFGIQERHPSKSFAGRLLGFLTWAAQSLVLLGLAYWSVTLFSLKFKPDWTISSAINFTQSQFANALTVAVPISIWLGVLVLAGNIVIAFSRSLGRPGSLFSRFCTTLGTSLMCSLAIWAFAISLVPYTVLDKGTATNLWPVVRRWHSNVDHFHLTSSYGLFRRMTGVGGRPELVLEASNNEKSGWKEIHFMYKPGSLSQRPPVVFPHQPRLDWQMWFAALGNRRDNPWLASLIYRLLSGQPEVVDLIDKSRYPFAMYPPKFIRAKLYLYYYTDFDQRRRRPNENDWWRRQFKEDYFPAVHKEHQALLKFLESEDIPTAKFQSRTERGWLPSFMQFVRHWSSSLSTPIFIWSILASAMTINLFSFLIHV